MVCNTIDDILGRIAPGLLENRGVIIFSAALSLYNPRYEAHDIDVYFDNDDEATNFGEYLVDLGAKERRKPEGLPSRYYNSFFGRYDLDGTQIEIMGDFKQLSKRGWWCLKTYLTVEPKHTRSGIEVAAASEATLLQLYRFSPRIWDIEGAPKKDFGKYMSLFETLNTDRTFNRGNALDTYFAERGIIYQPVTQ